MKKFKLRYLFLSLFVLLMPLCWVFIFNDSNNIVINTDVSAEYINPSVWEETDIRGEFPLDSVLQGQYIWYDLDGLPYYSYNGTNYTFQPNSYTWVLSSFTFPANFTSSYMRGDYIWNDGINVYLSYSRTQNFVFNKLNNSWSSVSFTFPSSITFRGDYIWYYGDNVYCSGGGSSSQLIFNSSSLSWSTYSTGFSSLYGYNVWYDNNGNVYSYQNYSTRKFLGGSWTSCSISGGSLGNASYFWTTGSNTYYNYNYNSYLLTIDGNNISLTSVTWLFDGSSYNFNGNNVWSYENNYFCTLNGSYQLIFNTYSVIPFSFYSITSIGAENIITYKGNVYNFTGSSYYFQIFNESTSLFEYVRYSGNIDSGVNFVGANCFVLPYADTEALFFANGSSFYLFNELTPSWSSVSFVNGSDIIGNDVWFDVNTGYAIYSGGSSSGRYFDINSAGDYTWIDFTWSYSGPYTNAISGRDIYRIGNDYYCMASGTGIGNSTFYLDTSNWSLSEVVTDYLDNNGDNIDFSTFFGKDVWTDGVNYYFSNTDVLQNYSFKLDLSLYSATSSIVWRYYSFVNSPSDFYGSNIWHYNNLVYYNYARLGYVLAEDSSDVVLTYNNVDMLFWSNVVGASYYNLYRNDVVYESSLTGNYYQLSLVGIYKIYAYNEFNNVIGISNIVVVSVRTLNAPNISFNGSILSWTAVDNADFYSVYYREDSNEDWKLLADITSTSYVCILSGDYSVVSRSYLFVFAPSSYSYSLNFTGMWTPSGSVSDYNFATLLSSVVDVPIHYIMSVLNLNMDFLGFNLLNLVTALFSLCVVIWFIRFILARK